MAVERKITRSRISYSCHTCRRRKVKCDKAHPVCGGCQKAGEQCIWSENETTNQQDAPQQVKSSASKKRKEHDDGSCTEVWSLPENETLRAIRQQLAQLNTLVNDMRQQTPPESLRSTPAETQAITLPLTKNKNTNLNAEESLARIQHQLNDLSTFLRSKGDADLNFTADLAAADLRKEEIANGFRDFPVKSDHRRPAATFAQSAQIPVSSTVRAVAAQIPSVDFLSPPEEEGNALIRSWLSSGYALFPIVSPSIVLTKWEAFRHWYRYELDRGIPNPDVSFMPLLYAIQYTGLVSISENAVSKWFPWTRREVLMVALRSRFLKSLGDCNYPSTVSLSPLIASIIMQTIFLHEQSGVENAMEVAGSLRAAQTLSIHRERVIKSLPVCEAQTKRKTWWELIHLDASLSMSTNLPPLTNKHFSDTEMPSELKHFKLDSKEASEYEKSVKEDNQRLQYADDPGEFGGASMISVYHMVAKARYTLARATQKLLKINMGAGAMSKDDMKKARKVLNETNKSIRSVIARIPARGVPELDFGPPLGSLIPPDHVTAMGDPITQEEVDYYEGKPVLDSYRQKTLHLAQYHRASRIAFHKWARIALSMMLERLNCISFAPFLKNAKSKLWAVARNCALKDCHGFMRKLISLASDPDLFRFRWTWPWLFQPMHAVIILLIDCFERPFSEEAPRSRALIDKMFSLASPENHIVGGQYGVTTAIPLHEGGKDAWEMLKQLRQRAWQKARLDPKVLWTEKDQLTVGIGGPLNENDIFKRSLREDIIYVHKQRTEQAESKRSPGEQPSQPMTPFQFTAAIAKHRHELLHPTQAGIPGDTMTGPLNVSIFEGSTDQSTSSHILLQARCDQQIMPFAYEPGSSSYEINITEESKRIISSTLDSIKAGSDGGSQVGNLRDLFTKIRETHNEQRQQQEKHVSTRSKQAVNSFDPKMDTPGVRESPGISQVSGQHRPLSHRSSPKVYHSVILANAPDTATGQGLLPQQHQATEGNPFCESSPNTAYLTSDPSNTVRGAHGALLSSQVGSANTESELNRGGNDLANSQILTPAPLHLHEDSNPTLAPNTETPMPQVSTPYVSETLDPSVNFDFDWTRWDEVFGQEYSGFEDMLMMDTMADEETGGGFEADGHVNENNLNVGAE